MFTCPLLRGPAMPCLSAKRPACIPQQNRDSLCFAAATINSAAVFCCCDPLWLLMPGLCRLQPLPHMHDTRNTLTMTAQSALAKVTPLQMLSPGGTLSSQRQKCHIWSARLLAVLRWSAGAGSPLSPSLSPSKKRGLFSDGDQEQIRGHC